MAEIAHLRIRDGHGSRTRSGFKGLGLNFLDPSDLDSSLDLKKI